MLSGDKRRPDKPKEELGWGGMIKKAIKDIMSMKSRTMSTVDKASRGDKKKKKRY